jgi:hypothetical protein
VNTATTESPPPIPTDLADLCELIASKDKVPVAQLLAGGKDVALLAKAIAKGFVVIGRQSYTEKMASSVPRIAAGKPVFDPETMRPVVDKKYEVALENSWSWTGLPPGRKSLRDLLDEEAKLDDSCPHGKDLPRLHVRVTTEGMAAISV